MIQKSKKELLKKLNSLGYNIVLIEPEIPTNTGNIGRLSLATGSKLHLVKPFGFEINDSRLKRAGLDYWQHLSVFTYENLEEFYSKNKEADMVYFSSHGKKVYTENNFKDNQFLIFGKESVGLPNEILDRNAKSTFHIPIYSSHVRSLNLANAVSVVIYEGLRVLKH